jgi:hypothetical protein
MLMRSLAGIIMIGVGAFAFYTVVARPQQPSADEPIKQAGGTPQIVARVIRGVVGLGFVALGIIVILKGPPIQNLIDNKFFRQ